MNHKDASGPAFPTDVDRASRGVVLGMTIRDYFAAKAMQGLVVGRATYPREWAEIAYEVADAMMEARE